MANSTLKCIALAVALGSLPVAALGAEATDRAALTGEIAARFAEGDAPGLVVALVKDNEIVLEAGFGVRDVETGRAATPDMTFRNGSTTKMMVAAALLEALAEKGLGVDAPIGSYVTGLDPAIGRLTAHQLLTHTSGLADKAEDFGLHDETALKINVESKNSADFFAEPGQTYSYSNPGYDTAGHVFQEVSGENFADSFEKRLLLPAGMTRSTFRATEAMTYPFALPHRRGAGGEFEIIRPMPDNSAEWPSGLMYTTVGDLARFAILLMQDGVASGGERALAAETVDRTASGHVAVPGSTSGRRYGYCLGVFEASGRRVWQHSGGIAGFVTLVTMLPDEGLAVTAMVNSGDGELLADVTNIVLAAEAGLTLRQPDSESAPLPPEMAARLAGNYGQIEVALRLGMIDGLLTSVNAEGEVLGEVGMVSPARFAIKQEDGAPRYFTVECAEGGGVRFIHAGSRALIPMAE